MKKTKLNNSIEYLSLILILSYCFIHNIYFVLAGISISLYLINLNVIKSIISVIKKKLVIKNISRDLNQNDKDMKYESINIKSIKENNKVTLVETIEELGYIPSIDKNNDSNAA